MELCRSVINVIVLSNELLVNPIRKYGHNIFSISTCVGGLLGNFLTLYFTSFQSLVLIIFVSYLVGLVFFMIFLRQSPSFLLKQHKYQELRQVIREIGVSNGVSESNIELALTDVESVIYCKPKAP